MHLLLFIMEQCGFVAVVWGGDTEQILSERY